MKCQHEWDKVSETVLPSGYEQMEAGNTKFDRMSGVSLFRKKYILVLSCKKCGKVKKVVEVNPD